MAMEFDRFTGIIQFDDNKSLANTAQQLQYTNQYGYVRIGPYNTSYAHFVTDRAKYYFDQALVVNNGGQTYTFAAYTGSDFIVAVNNGSDTVLTINKDSFVSTFSANVVINGALSIPGNTTLTADKIRIANTTDASLSSTGHGLQIGPTSGENVIIDSNEILARNNGGAAILYLNIEGTNVQFGGNLLPYGATGTQDIGTSTKYIKDLYANGIFASASRGTSGQVLTSGGASGSMTWTTPTTGTVTGTGTDNQIAVWTSSSGIEGTTGLTWDGTNLIAQASGTPKLSIQTTASSGQDAELYLKGARTASAASDVGRIRFHNVNYDMGMISMRDPDGNSSNKRGEIVFQTATGSSSITPRVKILKDGDLIPAGTTAATDLGTSSNYWDVLYIDSINALGSASEGTAGQVLTSGGAGGSMTWTTPTTGTVTGTGTDNRIALWNGTSAIDSDANIVYASGTNQLTATANVVVTDGQAFIAQRIAGSQYMVIDNNGQISTAPAIGSYIATNNAKHIQYNSTTDAWSGTLHTAGALGHQFKIRGTEYFKISQDTTPTTLITASTDIVPGADSAYDLGSSSGPLAWASIHGDQLRINYDGTGNKYDNAIIGHSASTGQTLIGHWDSNSTDIDGLLVGSNFGTIISGANSGHMVFALRDNDISDSLAIISGGGNWSADTTYDTVIARFDADGFTNLQDTLPQADSTYDLGDGATPLRWDNVYADQYWSDDSSTRNKYMVWNATSFAIGMGNNYYFGGLDNQYAMTFQMDNTANRGFWWGKVGHSNSQGAMSLTTDGRLVVANTILVGAGVDTTYANTTSTVYPLEVVGDTSINGDLYMNEGTIFFSTATGSVEKITATTSTLDLYADGTIRFMESDSSVISAVLDVNNKRFRVGDTANPTYTLDVFSSDTSDADWHATRIDANFSGSTALTATRTKSGLFIDLDSSATGGTTTNEHQVYGIYNDVAVTGDSDKIYGIYSLTDRNNTVATESVYGLYNEALASNSGGSVTILYGAYNYARNTGTTTVSNGVGSRNEFQKGGTGNIGFAAGSNNLVYHNVNSGLITNAMGSQNQVLLTSTFSTGTGITNAYGVNSTINYTASNPGGITSGFLFKGDYVLGNSSNVTNKWGLYITNTADNYITGDTVFTNDIKIGGGSGDVPSAALEVVGNITLTNTDTTLTDTDLVGSIDFYQSDTDNPGVSAGIRAYADGSDGNLALAFSTGLNTEAVRITAEGRLALGSGWQYQTSPQPQTPLHVNTSTSDSDALARFSYWGGSAYDSYWTVTPQSLELYATGIGVTNSFSALKLQAAGTNTGSGNISFLGGSSAYNYIGFGIYNAATDENRGFIRYGHLNNDMEFAIWNGSTGTVRAIIDSSGLEVVGNINFSGELQLSGSAGTSGYVLTSQGSGSSPVWAAAGGGGSVNFADLTNKTSGTGDYATTGDLVAGSGSGSIAMTVNDGYGNANLAFNHQNGVPDVTGSSGRIECSVDNATAQMYFELKNSTTASTAVTLTTILQLNETQASFFKPITCTGDITSNTSDRRLKTNLRPIQNALELIDSIDGYKFDWDQEKCSAAGFNPTRETEYGVIAQEIEEIMPEIITRAPFDIAKYEDDVEGRDVYRTVYYEKLTPLLIAAVKELKAEIVKLKEGK